MLSKCSKSWMFGFECRPTCGTHTTVKSLNDDLGRWCSAESVHLMFIHLISNYHHECLDDACNQLVRQGLPDAGWSFWWVRTQWSRDLFTIFYLYSHIELSLYTHTKPKIPVWPHWMGTFDRLTRLEVVSEWCASQFTKVGCRTLTTHVRKLMRKP